MKRRILSLFLILTVLFSFSACGIGALPFLSSRPTSVGGSANTDRVSVSSPQSIPNTDSAFVSSDGGISVSIGTITDSASDVPTSSSPVSDMGTAVTDSAVSSSDSEIEDAPDTPDSEYSPPSSSGSSGSSSSKPSTPSVPSTPSTPSEPSVPSKPEMSEPSEPWTPANKVKDMVIATDQYYKRVVVYDLSKISLGGSLDDAEAWSYNSGFCAGVKYREDTVFGDVVLIAGDTSAIVKYPSKQVVWKTTNSGNNPHSIEILPSGNVVIANSTGGTLRMFYSGVSGKKTQYEEYTLVGAHGVLWDPQRQLLWALGDYDLVSYTLSGAGRGEKLQEKNRYKLPATGGHDLAADFLDKNFLFITVNSTVYRFDKSTGVFFTTFAGSSSVVRGAVKGIGNNPNGNYFYAYPNGGPGRVWSNDSIAGWCTDSINFVRQTGWNTYSVERYSASKSAFYKVRVFYGKYQ